MIFELLTLFAALSLAAVADWFSIIGFMAIYAAAPAPILIMGVVLALAKLVATSWVYRNWGIADWKLKVPLIGFVLALMVTTSIGTFGFLSKAHLDQGVSTADNSSKIERLDQQIAREKSIISDDEKVIAQLDATINSYIGKDRTDKSLAVRRSQAPQRKQLRDAIDIAQKRIDDYSDERLKLQSEVRKQELDVGPVRYIAELFYGAEKDSSKNIEAAVRIFTLLIVSTLDPLAVILLVAANHTLLRRRNEKDKKVFKTESPSTEGTVTQPDSVGTCAGTCARSCSREEQSQGDSQEKIKNTEIFLFDNEENRHQTLLPDPASEQDVEVPLPLLPETLDVLDEITTGSLAETSTSIKSSTRLGNSNNELSTPYSRSAILHRKSETPIESSTCAPEALQEVKYEEKETTLEVFRKGSSETRNPFFPIIRSPRRTRISRDLPNETKMDDEIQETLVSHHLTPQTINEEEKTTQQEASEGGADNHTFTTTRSNAPQASPARAAEAQEIFSQRPAVETPILHPSDETPALFNDAERAISNKYPVILSWLAEFKKV
jgi:hypothetical protein